MTTARFLIGDVFDVMATLPDQSARMALARLEADMFIHPYEDWCINQSGIAPHTPKEVA